MVKETKKLEDIDLQSDKANYHFIKNKDGKRVPVMELDGKFYGIQPPTKTTFMKVITSINTDPDTKYDVAEYTDGSKQLRLWKIDPTTKKSVKIIKDREIPISKLKLPSDKSDRGKLAGMITKIE